MSLMKLAFLGGLAEKDMWPGTKLADPASLPPGYGMAPAFSPDGVYLAVGHYLSPHIAIYKRSGDTFTKLANPATLPASDGRGATFSPDGSYLAVAHGTTPFITIYKRSGDTFTKLSNPAALPASGAYDCAFSQDGAYLSVAHDTTPFITIYKRSGDTFTKLANPASLPTNNGRDVSFSPDGVYLALAHLSSPYIAIYKRSGDTFTKLANPATLPTANPRCVSFSPDGVYLAVGQFNSPYINIYKRSGDTFTKLANPASLPASHVNAATFSPDGVYLALGGEGSPLTVYKRSDDTFTKLANPSSIPSGIGRGVSFSPDGVYLALAHQGSPHITVYKSAAPPPPPTSGSEVFEAINYSGTAGERTLTTSMPRVDSALWFSRNLSKAPCWLNRSWIVGESCETNSTAASTTLAGGPMFNGNTLRFTNGSYNSTGDQGVWVFKKTRGFFDYVVIGGYDEFDHPSYRPHELGVTPELVIFRARRADIPWVVFSPLLPSGELILNSSAGLAETYMRIPIDENHFGDPNLLVPSSVAYMFASLPGISKIGTFTGNGSSQTIDCGFATGARFILIKRTDSTGDWMVWDYVNGIVAANDPYIRLNSNANPVASTDTVDPHPSGFIVNQNATSNTNVSGATYLYLAIA